MKLPKKVLSFLDEGLVGRSPRTISSYTSFANIFFSRINKPLEEITIEDIMRFLKWGQEEKGWKLNTIRYYALLAKRFMGELRDEEFVKQLSKQTRGLPSVQKYGSLYEGVYIPPDKIDPFIEAASNDRVRIVYVMVLKWGLRLSEALGQKIEDVYFDQQRITVRGKGSGFSHKIRNVFVDRDSLNVISRFIKGRKEGQIVSISPRTVQYAWKETARKIGLSNWKKLTVHDGRHSYAINFLIKRKKEGMAALLLLSNQLGHTDINTTRIYLDIAGTEARDVFEAGI